MSFFEIKNISCIRGQKLLFKNLNFKLNNKDLIVIKGPNGSGKTTLLKILSGLLKPISGSIIVNKKNINISKDEYFKYFEYIGHENAIKSALTVRENLNFYLTYKSLGINNLDKKFSKISSNSYWHRRQEQHKYYLNLCNKKKIFKGIDYYLTNIVCYFLKIFN